MLTVRPQIISDTVEKFDVLNVQGISFENQGSTIATIFIDDILVKNLAPNGSWGFASLTDEKINVCFDVRFDGSENRLLVLKMVKEYD